MVLALVLSSCSSAAEPKAAETITGTTTTPAATTTTTTAATTTTTTAATTTTTTPAKPTGPLYGGVLVFPGWNPSTWDPVTYPESAWPLDLTHDTLLVGDWAKGPTGDGTVTYNQWGPPPMMENSAGAIAESWEMLDPDTYLFHIRSGIFWHDKPPLNGRELTTTDVMKFFERVTGDYNYILTSYNYFEAVTQEGPNTIKIDMLPDSGAFVWPIFAEWVEVVPYEVIEEFGDYKMWENHVGTGPFIVTDYVSDSSITFERNPNYWNTDPLNAGNKLPYLDGAKSLIITDRSTYLAAFRAGKMDTAYFRWLDEVKPLRDVEGIVQTPFWDNSPWSVNLKMDDPALPTYDIDVRRALSLAVDRQTILDTIFEGEAVLEAYPGPYPELMGIFIPFDEMTPEAQYSYRYNPEEAKELLAKAGYPSGFDINILLDTGNEEMTSVIAAYWAEIGVNATLDVKEGSVRWSMQQAKTWTDAFANGRPDGLHISRMSDTIPGGVWNLSNMDDPKVNDEMANVRSLFHDTPAQHAALKDYAMAALETVSWVMLPLELRYNLHWDWVMDFNGAFNLDYQKYGRFTEFVWLDLDRKFELMGTRE